MPADDPTGMGLAFGTEEEGRAWRGRTVSTRRAACPISRSMIRTYAALVEDANPSFWEDDVCPPGLTMTLGFDLPWRPGDEPGPRPAVFDVPLPGTHIINVSTDTEFHRPLRAGDEVTVIEEVVDISLAKTTRLGHGHFITSRTTFSVGPRTCAVNTNVLFRYSNVEDA